MLRRLHHEQPQSFEFTPANIEWAKKQIAKYPEGRQASAVIPLLWRAQEQEGWISRPVIETVAKMLGMAEIRVLEVATFYYMFQLQPVGSVAHVQVCGTTSCMICGAEDLISVCKEKIAKRPFTRSEDGKFSWEEVECLGACANAPMVQIGKDYYEDLDRESFAEILDALSRGEVPLPGSRKGRFASEPEGGRTSLMEIERTHDVNASVALARALGDTVKRIDGTERTASDLIGHVPEHVAEQPQSPDMVTSWEREQGEETDRRAEEAHGKPQVGSVDPGGPTASMPDVSTVTDAVRTEERERDGGAPEDPVVGREPELLDAPDGAPDDLRRISGIGRKLAEALNEAGVYHYRQIASWDENEIAYMDIRLKLRGRIERDAWVAQARDLLGGKEEG